MTASRTRRRLAGLITLLAAAGCGLATWSAFPPVDAWWAAPVGLAGLSLLTSRCGGGASLLRGTAFGIGLFAPMLHFTAVSMGNALGWVALTLVESLYWAGTAWSWSLVSRLPVLDDSRRPGARVLVGRVLAFAVVVAGWEEIRCRFPWGGFPFGRLAFSAAPAPFLPVAAYLGSLGLTFLIALVAGCLATAVAQLLAPSRLRGGAGGPGRRVVRAATAAVVACLLTLAPVALPLEVAHAGPSVRVAAVQGDVASSSRDGAGAEAAFSRELEVTGNHALATRELAEQVGRGGVDLVVWPENAADLDPRQHASSARLVQEAAQAIGVPVLVGAVPYEQGDDGARVRYNDIVVWDPTTGSGQYYRKHRPVPFGEYVPHRQALRRLTSQVDRVGTDMEPGTGAHTLSVTARDGREIRMAMAICFEVAYDDVLRAGVREGGELIVVPTNNASFGSSSEAAQQLAQGQVQAVVHGRTLVQVSTVGVTAVISPKGGVRQQLPVYTRGSLVADVEVRRALTIADRLGSLPALVAVGGAVLLTAAGIVGSVARHVRGRSVGRTRHR